MIKRFRLEYSEQALRDIKKLDSVVQKRLKEAIERFVNNPLHYARKLKDAENLGQYRWRAGAYRIIFDLSGHRVRILHIGHRREIYR